MDADVLGVIMFEIAVVALVKENDDSHDLAQAQLGLSGVSALAVLNQALGIERFKRLAKVIDIAEYSDELAHEDLRWLATTSWSIQSHHTRILMGWQYPPAYPELRFINVGAHWSAW